MLRLNHHSIPVLFVLIRLFEIDYCVESVPQSPSFTLELGIVDPMCPSLRQ